MAEYIVFAEFSICSLTLTNMLNTPSFIEEYMNSKHLYFLALNKDLLFFNTCFLHKAVCPAALAGRERFIIIIYTITHSPKCHPSPTPSFLRHHII